MDSVLYLQKLNHDLLTVLEYHFTDPPIYKLKTNEEKLLINEEDFKVKPNQVSSDSSLKYKAVTAKEKKKLQQAAKEISWLIGSNTECTEMPPEIALDV